MDLMIDLETLGTNPDCPVISIGAVFFNTKDGLLEEFYETLDVNIQIEEGRKATGDTIKWWMSQSNAAQIVFKEGAKDPVEVLKNFIKFCNTHGKGSAKPWGNGSTFDVTIMEDLLNFYKLDIPWKFWNIRDLRTFKEEVYNGKDLKFNGVEHYALDDAKHQALLVIEGRKRNK